VKILSRAAVDLMTTNQTPTLPKSFGLGWEVTSDVSQRLHFTAPGTFGHGGALGTQAWIDPAHKLIGIFLIQRWGGGVPDAFPTFQGMVNTALDE
jgi:CubicO group peptidase (beta-lactamase class C family)